MAQAASTDSQRYLALGTKAHFLGWEVLEPRSDSPNTIHVLGPTAIKLKLRVNFPIRRGHHGITLYNSDRQLVWGRAAEGLRLDAGVHDLIYEFPVLPIKPGPYIWMVSIWDDEECIEMVDLAPELIVSTPSHQHPLDEWSGFLNIPSSLTVSTNAETKEPKTAC